MYELNLKTELVEGHLSGRQSLRTEKLKDTTHAPYNTEILI